VTCTTSESGLSEIRKWAEEALGYRFRDPRLLLQALTHASFGGEGPLAHNERLEFLGDSVLNAVVSHRLFLLFPKESEGTLTRRRVAVVCNENLAKVGGEIGVISRMRVGKSLEMQMSQGEETVVADAFEALVGAVFLDGGFEAASAMVEGLLFSREIPRYSNAKGFLQELVVERFGVLPVYRHTPCPEGFKSRVEVNGCCLGEGRGRSKKEADQDAARQALKLLGEGK